MTIKSSGTLSISDIVAEFGSSGTHSLSEYYRGGSRVPNTPANSGIPTSGTITLSDFYGASAIADISYVGTNFAHIASGFVGWPAGTQAGDMAMIMTLSNNNTNYWTGMSGWSQDSINELLVSNGSGWACLYSKVISAGDVSSPPQWVGGGAYAGMLVVVYRGGSLVKFKGATYETGTTITIPGFTKSTGSSRIAAFFVDRTNSGLYGTPPSGFTERVRDRITYYNMGVADRAASGYANGTNIVWTAMHNQYYQDMAVYELI